ncbi:MAG: hypothetical protein Q8M15_07060 [Bacteroidota bacterium]|nr:hypothetical protein [Bacteroidota bacterium]
MNLNTVKSGILILATVICLHPKAFSQKNDISYGYSPENPIKVGKSKKGGPANERIFLELLRDAHEDPVTAIRIGSCCPFPSKSGIMGVAMCDLFKIKYRNEKGKAMEVIIYLTFYEYDKPEAPTYFTIATQDIDKELQPILDSVPDYSDIREYRIKSENVSDIPEYIYQMTNLEVLEIDSNEISVISPGISNLRKLKKLKFSGNKIKRIPGDFVYLDSLEELHLNRDMDWDDTFSKLSKLPNLKKLNLNETGIKILPAEIQKFALLEEICLKSNPELILNDVFKQLSGVKKLKILRLGNDTIKEIPQSIELLKNLEELEITNTQIKFLPVELGEVRKLRVLNLNANSKLITIPESIKNLTQLEEVYFELMKTQFKYTDVLTRLSNCANLKKLMLHQSQGLMNLPGIMGKMKNLEYLNITACRDLNMIPKEIGQLSKLKFLEIGSNAKITTLPVEISKLQNLEILDISGHSGFDFKKEFPKFCHLKKLEILIIDRGDQQIPESVKGCKQVKVLQMKSYNNKYTTDIEKERLKKLMPFCEIIY